VKSLAFFNNKGGVGKTSLVYHLAWTYSDLGVRVLVADLDPQANLTASFLDEDAIDLLWQDQNSPNTVSGCLRPLIEGTGDVAEPKLREITDRLSLIPGDLTLSAFEDQLSSEWPNCLEGQPRAFRVISAFWRIVRSAAVSTNADLVLMDVGPNLGAINRAALIASDFVAVPLSPDLYSLQGLRNLGPTLRQWREGWEERLRKKPSSLSTELPKGDMQPIGYIVLQHAVRLDRPVKAYDRWIARIPGEYRDAVLEQSSARAPSVSEDPNCLAQLKHYRSLMPLAQEARKPMFHLRAADGAIGAHAQAVQQAARDFNVLAGRIAGQIDISVFA
jgi:cellulose biosynthesis protein BcsQ